MGYEYMRCKACDKELNWDEKAFCDGYCFDCFNEGEYDISVEPILDIDDHCYYNDIQSYYTFFRGKFQ